MYLAGVEKCCRCECCCCFFLKCVNSGVCETELRECGHCYQIRLSSPVAKCYKRMGSAWFCLWRSDGCHWGSRQDRICGCSKARRCDNGDVKLLVHKCLVPPGIETHARAAPLSHCYGGGHGSVDDQSVLTLKSMQQ